MKAKEDWTDSTTALNWIRAAVTEHRRVKTKGAAKINILRPVGILKERIAEIELVVGGCSEWEWVLIRILRVLHSRLVPLQIQHKFYKHIKQMKYNNDEH